jgi:hypothetical protein
MGSHKLFVQVGLNLTGINQDDDIFQQITYICFVTFLAIAYNDFLKS